MLQNRNNQRTNAFRIKTMKKVAWLLPSCECSNISPGKCTSAVQSCLCHVGEVGTRYWDLVFSSALPHLSSRPCNIGFQSNLWNMFVIYEGKLSKTYDTPINYFKWVKLRNRVIASSRTEVGKLWPMCHTQLMFVTYPRDTSGYYVYK